MTTLTIQNIDLEMRHWDGPNGPMKFISGTFTDGTGWSLGAKPENAAKRAAELAALVGKEGEYEVEAKGEFRGKPQWKLKGWPGKPVFGGGGGGKAPRDETGMAIGAAGHDAATLVAAMITKGNVEGWENSLGIYEATVKRIFEHNGSLRSSITLPVSSAETGAGEQHPVSSPAKAGTVAGRTAPVPTTSPVSTKSDPERQPGLGEGVRATGDREWEAKPEGKPADAPCSHVDRSPLKPDGSQLPSGFMRCLRCGTVSK